VKTTSLHSGFEPQELGGKEADKLRRLVLDKLPPLDDRISAISLKLRITASWFYDAMQWGCQHEYGEHFPFL